jgi:hypothetical protein
MMKRYVTYDADGTLSGCYLQELPAAGYILADESIVTLWPLYRANDARDGLELIPLSDPATLPALVPQEVSMRQARLALLKRGVLNQVDAAINSLPSPDCEAARIEWDYSSVVARNSPLVTMMGAALGLDDASLDELFIAAALL